jgi:galactofuranose transport system permease protein
MIALSIKRDDLLAPAMAVLMALLTFVGGAMAYDGFSSARNLLDLLRDNAWLGIAAAGATMVILSGGIDLSVGSMIAFTTVLLAVLIERLHIHPVLAIAVSLLLGVVVGAAMGSLIHFYALPAFMVTLAGLFLLRSTGFALAEWTNPAHVAESIGIRNSIMLDWSMAGVRVDRGVKFSAHAMALLTVYVVFIILAHRTILGRNIYGLGGDESAARLMGVPVGRTKIWVYALAGFSSAAAGVAATIYKSSGDPAAFVGAELDVITAVVIGGTLLRGGSGYIAGTFCGVIIIGLIQSIINFQGTLAGAWPRIIIGSLLLIAILLQQALAWLAKARLSAPSPRGP